jgi:hypothetical protein
LSDEDPALWSEKTEQQSTTIGKMADLALWSGRKEQHLTTMKATEKMVEPW